METTPRRLLVLVCLFALLLAVPAGAQKTEGEPEGPGVYIVRLADRPVAAYQGGVPGFAATRPERPRGGRRRLDAGSPASRSYAGYLRQRQDEALARIGKVLGREARPLSRYSLTVHGFALELSADEAKRIARVPGVLQVQRSREMVPQSDAGPAWTGAGTIWDGSGTGGLPGTRGEGMVVGVIDSGLNAAHPSFADVGGDGYDHANPRGAGQYVGRCDPADPEYDPAIPCNDKLIGLWAYGLGSGTAPADETGHGTHVAATAVGNHLTATLSGPGIDLVRNVSGVAPHANLIAYDVCWASFSCASFYFLEAVDQAVADGVDVLSVGFGASIWSPWEDPLAEALLNAREAGVFVAVPAGNSGYSEGLTSVAEIPWVMAVTATTHHRRLASYLKVMTGGGSTPPADIQGWGLSGPYGPAPVVRAGAYGDSYCTSPFPAGTWSGQIVVCGYDPWDSAAAVSANVLAGGAGGVVLADDYSYSDDPIPPLEGLALPAVYIRTHIYELFQWLYSGSGHSAVLSGTIVETDPALADIFHEASSQGPSYRVTDVAKPDLAAPGVDILAADHDSEGFVFKTGTSMAAAHAAGAAALVMALHPDWSPSEVQSALMTTAKGTVMREGGAPAETFEVGAGRLDVGAAARAGLLLDVTADEFAQAAPTLAGHPETLNLPSLGDGFCVRTCTWTRTVRSVLDVASTWTASSTVPAGLVVTVTPSSFTLAPGESRTLQITVDASPSLYGWREGAVVLTPSGSVAPPARLPIGARWVPEYQLTVNRAGGGSGRVTSSPAGIDCGSDCTELYPDDSWVVLTAVPDPGSVFAGWSDWYCGASPTCGVDMYTQRTLTAHFAVPAPDRPLANGVPLRDSLNGPVENGLWNYYYVDLPAGTGELVVDVLDLNAEVSLLVRHGAKPTWSSSDCYDAWWGSLHRRCVIQNPAAGRWWIGLNNEDTGSIAFSVRAAWGGANGADRLLTNGLVAGDFLTASSAGAAWKYFFFDVESGATNLTVELSDLSGDVDLLVRRGAKPDRSFHDCDSSQGSTLTERCSFANPQPGRWWVAVNNFGTGTLHFKVRAGWATPPTSFYTVQPCRVLDTRSSSPLVPGPSRVFQVTGVCGIPATARAVVANVTAVLPTGQGHITLHPGNQPPPLASSVNFRAGQVRANNGILNLPADGSGTLGAATALLGGGHVHLLVDVTGYFQ